jgi:hypothetical protein
MTHSDNQKQGINNQAKISSLTGSISTDVEMECMMVLPLTDIIAMS